MASIGAITNMKRPKATSDGRAAPSPDPAFFSAMRNGRGGFSPPPAPFKENSDE